MSAHNSGKKTNKDCSVSKTGKKYKSMMILNSFKTLWAVSEPSCFNTLEVLVIERKPLKNIETDSPFWTNQLWIYVASKQYRIMNSAYFHLVECSKYIISIADFLPFIWFFLFCRIFTTKSAFLYGALVYFLRQSKKWVLIFKIMSFENDFSYKFLLSLVL